MTSFIKLVVTFPPNHNYNGITSAPPKLVVILPSPASFKSRERTSPVPPPPVFYPAPRKNASRLFSAFFVLQGRNSRDEAKIQDHVTPNWAAQRGWLGGGLLNIFGIFTPIPGEMIQFDEHIFQMGWNHQLDGLGAGFGALIFESFPVSLFSCETADGFVKSGYGTHLECYKRLKIMGEATKLNWLAGYFVILVINGSKRTPVN